ncbi:hypothetical protein ACLKA6_015417 [Drosophila palustris]
MGLNELQSGFQLPPINQINNGHRRCPYLKICELIENSSSSSSSNNNLQQMQQKISEKWKQDKEEQKTCNLQLRSHNE